MATAEHAHEWGPVERSHFAGTPHRKCTGDGCKAVTLDLCDDDTDNDTEGEMK